jgi:hypothetical protein
MKLLIAAAMLGAWCPAPDTTPGLKSQSYIRSTHETAKDDPECIEVSQTGFHGGENECKFIHIKTFKFETDMGDKRTNYIIHMICEEAGEEGPNPYTATFTIIDNELVIKDNE